MTYDNNGIMILLSAILNWAREHERPVVLVSSSRECQLEIGVIKEGYPRFVNVPYIKRHGIMSQMTTTGILEKIESMAFGTGIPSTQQFIDMLEAMEKQWIQGYAMGNRNPYTVGGMQVTGYVNNGYAVFDYGILPPVLVDYKGDNAWRY